MKKVSLRMPLTEIACCPRYSPLACDSSVIPARKRKANEPCSSFGLPFWLRPQTVERAILAGGWKVYLPACHHWAMPVPGEPTCNKGNGRRLLLVHPLDRDQRNALDFYLYAEFGHCLWNHTWVCDDCGECDDCERIDRCTTDPTEN